MSTRGFNSGEIIYHSEEMRFRKRIWSFVTVRQPVA